MSRDSLVPFASMVAALAICAIALPAADADAAPYTVHSCRLPDGSPAPTVGWEGAKEPATGAGITIEDTCPAGGGIGGAVAARSRAGYVARWTFRPPPATVLRSAKLVRRTRVSGDHKPPSGAYGAFANAPGGAVTALEQCVGYPCTLPTESRHTFLVSPLSVTLQAWCHNTGDDGCVGDREGYTAAFVLQRAELTLDDTAAPTVSEGPWGSLLTGGAKSGVQEVRVAGRDEGSGVAAFRVEADGRTVAESERICRPPYTSPKPCPANADTVVGVDTRRLGPGEHEVRVVVVDAAGNETASASSPVTGSTGEGYRIFITNAGPSRSSAAPRGALRASYRRPPKLGGTFQDRHGKPVADSAVGLYQRVAGTDGPDRLVAQARTNAEGKWRLDAPRGPSRGLVVAGFPGAGEVPNNGLNGAAAAAALALRVRAGITWSASRKRLRRGRVRFSGRLLGGSIPPRGKIIELQALDRRRWRTIASARTRSNGRFRLRYSLRPVGRTVRYSFRIFVRAENGYPFATTGSSRRTVTVVRSF